jgi:hypothetical protein
VGGLRLDAGRPCAGRADAAPARRGFRRFCQPPAFQSPNLWWPADRVWCVASDIDLPSTYLGGTRALVEEVPGDDRLEAVPARLTDPVHP